MQDEHRSLNCRSSAEPESVVQTEHVEPTYRIHICILPIGSSGLAKVRAARSNKDVDLSGDSKRCSGERGWKYININYLVKI